MEDKKQVKISVRSLVEFIFRSGDLDNRSRVNPEQAMMEGSRIHRMLQRKEGAGYHSEVGLKWCHQTQRYQVLLEGRADGIIEDYVPVRYQELEEQFPLFSADYGMVDRPEPATYIDEIKSTSRRLRSIQEPVREHLAQAKCYAYIVTMEEDLEQIGVRISYCHRDSKEMKYFHYMFSRREIIEWFNDAMISLERWLDYYVTWKECKKASIRELKFPYDYREGQKELAGYVYQTIYHQKKLFLEAPTGVGKTLSTVFPSVKAIGQELSEKLFYLTAKTITRTVAEETFSLLRHNGLAFKDMVITAKEKTCINDCCQCDPLHCPYAKGHFDRVNECLYAIITRESRFGREIIEQYAREYEVCPYELSLDISLFADGVICDYNYVFDPHVYLRRYFGGENSGKYLFLIDEAHNLLDRGREMYSAALVKETVLEVKTLVKEEDRELARQLDKLNKALLALKKQTQNTMVFEDVEEVYNAAAEVQYRLDIYINERNDRIVADEIMDFFFQIDHFCQVYANITDKYVIYGCLREDGKYLLKLYNVDPSANLRERMKKARSTILFSATLLPIQYYKGLLGGEKEDYEVYAHSVFPPSNRGLFVARDVTSKYTRRGPREYERIADYLYQMVKARKGNYLSFFPSYAFMKDVYEVYLAQHPEHSQQCLLQQEQMSEEDREAYLAAFRSHGDHTVLGFCVTGGIFSEGIDLKKDCLIGAAIVGTGLPQVGQERELLKTYFDRQGLDGFDYAYRFPGMNKVLQAAGRVIRTAEDVGVILLLDERFLQQAFRNLYPREWEHIEVTDVSGVFEKLQEFWAGHNLTES